MTARERYLIPIKNRINNPSNKYYKVELLKYTIDIDDILGENIERDYKHAEGVHDLLLSLCRTIMDLQIWSCAMDKELDRYGIIKPPEDWNEANILLAKSDSLVEDKFKKYLLYNYYDKTCKDFYDRANAIMDNLRWARN